MGDPPAAAQGGRGVPPVGPPGPGRVLGPQAGSDLFGRVFEGGEDVLVAEGSSHGEHRDGPWRAGVPEHGAGRWCDVFEIRDWKIQRCFIYLDPDYAGKDTARYPWLKNK